MNVYNKFICPVIVDYAHNKLSVKNLLDTLIDYYPNHNIKLVFGCPGDKGLNRRKELAILAGKYCHFVYLTAEDPGTKKVKDICKDVGSFLKEYNTPYQIIEDRKTAINKAIDEAKENDIIAIIGKGDETYQFIDNKFIPRRR
jgi:UDP-N-acetylmuramyl tripeptide synthase